MQEQVIHQHSYHHSADASQSILSGHLLHGLVFGLGVIVYFTLGFRLYYRQYQRTGRWQHPR